MSDSNIPLTDINQKVEEFIDYAAQMVTGIYMSVHKMTGEYPNFDIAKYLLAQYLNGCFQSLIKKNDEFVMNFFNKIDHSPVCLIHKLFTVGCAVVQNIGKTFDEYKTIPIDTKRTKIRMAIKMYLMTIKSDLKPLLDHKCDGKRDLSDEPEDSVVFKFS